MYSETAQRVNLSRSERMKRSQRIELSIFFSYKFFQKSSTDLFWCSQITK